MNTVTCHLVQSCPLNHKKTMKYFAPYCRCPKVPKCFLCIKETTQVLTCNKGISKKVLSVPVQILPKRRSDTEQFNAKYAFQKAVLLVSLSRPKNI